MNPVIFEVYANAATLPPGHYFAQVVSTYKGGQPKEVRVRINVDSAQSEIQTQKPASLDSKPVTGKLSEYMEKECNRVFPLLNKNSVHEGYSEWLHGRQTDKRTGFYAGWAAARNTMPASLDSNRHEAKEVGQRGLHLHEQLEQVAKNCADSNELKREFENIGLGQQRLQPNPQLSAYVSMGQSLHDSLSKKPSKQWRVTLTFSDDSQCMRTVYAESPLMAYSLTLQDARMGSESSPQYNGDVVHADIHKLNATTPAEGTEKVAR